MTDKFLPKENLVKTEEVRELTNEYPSFEEFTRTYEYNEHIANSYEDEYQAQGKGVGPCRNTLCGCSCSKDVCDCGNLEGSIYGKDNWKVGNATASGNTGLDGNSVSADGDFSLYRDTRMDGDVKVGTFSAGFDAVNGGLGCKAKFGANAVNIKSNGWEAKAGLNLDTGGGISSDGIEFKVLGAGVNVGKKMEVSTPFGGVSKDCVIQ